MFQLNSPSLSLLSNTLHSQFSPNFMYFKKLSLSLCYAANTFTGVGPSLGAQTRFIADEN